MTYVFIVQIKEDTIDELSETLHVFESLIGVFNFLRTKVDVWKQYDWETVDVPKIPTLDYITTELSSNNTATLYTFGNYAVDRYIIEFIVHKRIIQ
jgi:hypothetical protein